MRTVPIDLSLDAVSLLLLVQEVGNIVARGNHQREPLYGPRSAQKLLWLSLLPYQLNKIFEDGLLVLFLKILNKWYVSSSIVFGSEWDLDSIGSLDPDHERYFLFKTAECSRYRILLELESLS
jgi:hypothetical protein